MSKEYEEIREEIARDIYFDGEDFKEGSVADVTWRASPARREKYLARATKLLNLKTDTCHVSICKNVPELPDNPWGDDVHLDAGKYDGLYRKRYNEAQQDMLDDGFEQKAEETT